MKFTKEDKEIDARLRFSRQNLKDLERYSLYGIPKEDKKGHTRFFNVRVQPLQMDMIEGIKEKIPGWYKSNSELYRSIIAAGTYVILTIMERDYDVDDLKDVLHDMNYIEMQCRLEDLKDQKFTIKQRVVESNLPEGTKKKVINLLEIIEKKYMDILKGKK